MLTTPDFGPKIAAEKLLREARSGAPAALMAGPGDPNCSSVNVATAPARAPLLLLSRREVHTVYRIAVDRAHLVARFARIVDLTRDIF
jgi:hypothetical protein